MPWAVRLAAVLGTAAALAGLAFCGEASATAAAADAAQVQRYSAQALYNAGNAYARRGNTGMAILDYERARILAPNDPDIRANLERVRAKAGLDPAPGSWIETRGRLGDPDRLYWSGIAGLMLSGCGALAIRFAPRRRRRPGWLALAFGLPLCAVALWDAAATWPVMHEAVVLRATPARVSPADTGDSLFALPEGQVVRMSDRYRGFTLVRMPGGPAGWVAAADLAPVSPDAPAI